MYNFVDVNKISADSVLPAEALQINGEYIENLIPGYRTLGTTGREALSPELNYYETGIRDGSIMKSRRYPARTIIIKYQLIAADAEAFRSAYNELGRILNVDDAELIFNDEPDKFFTGTPSFIADVEPGRNAVVGEFEIFCADPFKYSIVEYDAVPDTEENAILIDYGGTYKAFPVLEAAIYSEYDTSEDGETETPLTGDGDCGYVAFFNEKKKIIQLGDPDEVDTVEHPRSQTLINSSFNKSTSWGTAAKKQWTVNGGKTSSSSVVQTGTIAMKADEYNSETYANTSGTLLKATSKAGAPVFNYKVSAKTYDRTSTAVKVKITVTTALGADSSYFGRGYSLQASVYIGGAWKNIKLKGTDEYWKGKSGHTANLTVTVSGLSASASSLTGIKFKVTRPDGSGNAGLLSETKCADLKVGAYSKPVTASYYLAPSNFGTGDTWHGASITRRVPPDASGDTNAVNCNFSFSNRFAIGTGKNASKEYGGFQVILSNGSGENRKIVAGISLFKSAAGSKSRLRFYVNGSTAETIEVSVANNNTRFIPSKTSSIAKLRGNIKFNIGGIVRTYKDNDLYDVAIDEVTITMMQHSTRTVLSHNGLYSAKFVKTHCDKFEDIPNKLSSGDVVTADCKTGNIYLNGVLSPELGALGNDWEDFYLQPGLNQIGFACSDWLTPEYMPDFTIRYREVFL